MMKSILTVLLLLVSTGAFAQSETAPAVETAERAVNSFANICLATGGDSLKIGALLANAEAQGLAQKIPADLLSTMPIPLSEILVAWKVNDTAAQRVYTVVNTANLGCFFGFDNADPKQVESDFMGLVRHMEKDLQTPAILEPDANAHLEKSMVKTFRFDLPHFVKGPAIELMVRADGRYMLMTRKGVMK